MPCACCTRPVRCLEKRSRRLSIKRWKCALLTLVVLYLAGCFAFAALVPTLQFPGGLQTEDPKRGQVVQYARGRHAYAVNVTRGSSSTPRVPVLYFGSASQNGYEACEDALSVFINIASVATTQFPMNAELFCFALRGYAPNAGSTAPGEETALQDAAALLRFARRKYAHAGPALRDALELPALALDAASAAESAGGARAPPPAPLAGPRVLALGFDLGAAIVAKLAQAEPDQLAGLGLFSPWTDLWAETLRYAPPMSECLAPWIWLSERYDTLDACQNAAPGLPLAVFSPTRDTVVAPSDHRAVFDGCAAMQKFWIPTKDARHGDLFHQIRSNAASVASWLDEVDKQRTAAYREAESSAAPRDGPETVVVA